MTSSYSLRTSRSQGPSKSTYPLGTFFEDYEYTHKRGTLDHNNGRFCLTPEYPDGVYAYFVTVDGTTPVFPYIIGENYYACLLYTSPSPRDRTRSRMPSSA